MNRKIAIIIFITVIILLSGCTSNTTINGKYTSTAHPSNYMIIKSDGSFFVNQEGAGGISFGGQYHVENDIIYLIVPFGTITATIDKNGDLIDQEGVKWKRK
jgi:uncharacterized protein YceK